MSSCTTPRCSAFDASSGIAPECSTRFTIGQRVATLFRGAANAGMINTVRFDAAQLPSGIYFSRLQFKDKTLIHKMMLMK